jgi:hypothetical protein
MEVWSGCYQEFDLTVGSAGYMAHFEWAVRLISFEDFEDCLTDIQF